MLTPSQNWHWQYNEQQQRLILDLGDEMLFVTPYKAKQLSADILHAQSQGFSLEDMEAYLSVQEQLEQSGLSLSKGIKTQIAINATAVKSFYRPLMPKSWYFQRQNTCGSFHNLSVLVSEHGQALVLNVVNEGDTVVCMLLSQKLILDGTKQLQQFDVIKVMADCLCPYIPQVSTNLAKSA